jgi:hypothetical protein
MSIAKNNLKRELAYKSLFSSAKPVLSTASNWNQGDILAYDATNNIINAVTGTGSSANLVGVAVNTVVSGKQPSPYSGTAVDASQAIEDMAGPRYGSIFTMSLNTGDIWVPGQAAYLMSDPQTLTSAVTGNSVGIYQGPAITSAASGTTGDFLIGARYLQPGLVT